MTARWLDLAEIVFDARERAYRLYLDHGEHRGAARVAVAVTRPGRAARR